MLKTFNKPAETVNRYISNTVRVGVKNNAPLAHLHVVSYLWRASTGRSL